MIREMLSAFHIIAFLGVGGIVAIAAVVVGILVPRFLYVALIVAAVAAVSTFIYAKGVHDDFKLQRQRELTSAAETLQTESKARSDAIRAEHAERVKPNGVRDPYDRDRPDRVRPAAKGDHRAPRLRAVAPH